jgi:putative hydrolase of the HAD superfamily
MKLNDELPRRCRSSVADWDACVRHLPGLGEMLAGLSARYRLAVVSNTVDTDLVPAHPDAMGVRHYFDAVVLSVETGWRKPHPGIFTAASMISSCQVSSPRLGIPVALGSPC